MDACNNDTSDMIYQHHNNDKSPKAGILKCTLAQVCIILADTFNS
jgi:hypothetical protein